MCTTFSAMAAILSVVAQNAAGPSLIYKPTFCFSIFRAKSKKISHDREHFRHLARYALFYAQSV